LSGIGPKSVLKAAGVNVRVELDAVGSNFQDHPYATVVFNTTTNTFPNQNSLATNATSMPPLGLSTLRIKPVLTHTRAVMLSHSSPFLI
jgi:choline dehydrogenase-like flavoprotein